MNDDESYITPTGPKLTYTHTTGDTFTHVDVVTIQDDARERLILRALLTYALRLLDEEEARHAF